MKSDLDYLKIAYEVAAKFSTDPSTQNGAVLVNPNGDILVAAANCFPNGVIESAERWQRPTKYEFVEHAERNVIYAAARDGILTRHARMYVPWYSCADCARAIIQSGITEVIGHQKMFDGTPARWKDSIASALKMFDEAGIRHRLVPGDIGVKIRFNEQEWES